MARQATWGVGSNLIGVGLRYALILLIARYYGPFALGTYGVAIAVALAATLVATVGVDRAVLRFVPYYTSQRRPDLARRVTQHGLAVTCAVSALTAVLLFGVSGPLASVFHEHDLRTAFHIMSALVPIRAVGLVLRAKLRTSEDVRLPVALEQIVVPATNLAVVAFGLAHSMLHPWPLMPVVGQVAGQAAATLVSVAALARLRTVSQSDRSTRPLRSGGHGWLSYALPMWFEALAVLLLGSVDSLLLAHFRSVTQLGTYTPAVRLSVIVGMPLVALNAVLEPMLARLDGARDRAALQSLYVRVNCGTAAVGIFLGVVVISFGKPLLRIFGATYSSAYPALVILVAGQVVSMATGSSGTLLTMIGWGRLALANATTALTADVVLCAFLIPRFGATGAATAATISFSLLGVAQLLQVRLMVGLRSLDRSGWNFWMSHARAMIRSRLPA